MRIIFPLLSVIFITACSKETKTNLKNNVGSDIVVEVLTKNYSYHSELIKAMDHMDIVEKVEDIISIKYRYEGGNCNLSSEQIRLKAYPTKGGIFVGNDHKTVDITKC